MVVEEGNRQRFDQPNWRPPISRFSTPLMHKPAVSDHFLILLASSHYKFALLPIQLFPLTRSRSLSARTSFAN